MDLRLTPVILAAGHGKRMKSNLPKVLHPLAGLPIIHHVLRAVRAVATEPPVVVIGHGADRVRQAIGEGVRFAYQAEQLGTAHALQMAEPLLAGQTDLILVVTGDMPLLTPTTFRRLIALQAANPGPLSLVTLISDNSYGFGRILRSPDGNVQGIVEEAQATPEQLAIRELNASVYCFDAHWIWEALRRVPLSPKGEYYLTDVVGLAVQEGQAVQTLVLEDPQEALGINTRVHLAEAEAIMRRRITTTWMENGITIIDPNSTYIEMDVQIGRDTVIYPFTCLRGATRIGQNCRIGPFTLLQDVITGADCHLVGCALQDTYLESGTSILPTGGATLTWLSGNTSTPLATPPPEDLSPHYE
ncbi:NTP transferase domain-containing protein [uncultured Thermanaerothrix sp.]|uniref:bifunctional UDP-N-acetylglucosamine diphosphorylase/glucosamine-1-phosphate N-acetyltransferase GlmU n=1 Tax=uncultured Thermanaerothrix sp. TaxID=1195149 RepID=UPI00261BB7DA|nr:NTP transferase domain-containing protein [uncultured Thermanaerothrix sp.]